MTAYDQTPPHDQQAEHSVVASLLVEGELINAVATICAPADFFHDADRWTYEACLSLWERSVSINQVTVAHELETRGKLEEAGGLYYLSNLVLELATPVGVEHYAAIVHRDAAYRQMISAGNAIAQLGYRAGNDLDAALSKAEEYIYSLRDRGQKRDFVHISTLLDPFLEPPADETPQAYGGRVRSGIGALDALLGGFNPSDLIIIAARTSMGKTALMLNLAKAAAVGQQETVAVFSLEMSGEQVAQRLLASQSGVDLARLRLGLHNEQEETRIMHAHGALSSAAIYVDDSSLLQPGDLRSKLRRLQQERPVGLVVVDYLQLMQGGRSENRVQEISGITRALKQLARELDIAIVAGSQLSRATEQRAGHLPMLSDLRESGSIEQDADVVVFIHREEVYTRREEWEATHPDRNGDPYPQGVAQLIVAKHRNGPTGTAVTRFHERLSLFEDVEARTP